MSDTLAAAQDLAEIRRLAGELEAQAFDKADDHDMPGGEALASLAPVASPEAVWNVTQGRELWNDAHDLQLDLSHLEDGDLWEAPLQTLLYWSERLRYEHDALLDTRPTIETEARWLGNSLNWIHQHEPRFDDFASDLWATRRRLEAMLRDGQRVTPGIVCPRCHNSALIRTEHDRSRPRGCNGHGALKLCPIHRCDCGDRGGLIDEWRCPKCGEHFKLDEYQAAVSRDYVAHADWLPGEYVERRTAVTHATVRVWATRGHIRTRRAAVTRDGETREMTVYSITDIETRHAEEAMLGEPSNTV